MFKSFFPRPPNTLYMRMCLLNYKTISTYVIILRSHLDVHFYDIHKNYFYSTVNVIINNKLSFKLP